MIPIWESEMAMERAAAGKKEEGREKMAHCVIITSDMRNMNLEGQGDCEQFKKEVESGGENANL